MTASTRIAPHSRTTRTAALCVAALLTFAGCAANGDASAETSVAADQPITAPVEPPVIVISGSVFETSELRVAPGTTVVWQNTDPFAHTVTSRDDAPVAFDSGQFKDGDTFEFTFDEPGEYAYFCQIHPTMRAVVIVG